MKVSATPTKPDDHKYDEYAVQSAMDTLIHAEEIRADSKMMGLVSKHLTKKKKAINSIADLKAAGAEMDKEDAADAKASDEKAEGE